MGGSKKQTVGYRYFMGLHFGLCHGPVDAFLEIRGGDRVAWDGSAQVVKARILESLGLDIVIPVGYEPATGPITTSQRIKILAPELWGGEKKEGGIVGELDVMMGEPTQQANDYLASQIDAPMPAFRGLLTLVFRKGMVGAMNPYPKPWKFRVRRVKKGWHGGDGTAWYADKAEIDLIGAKAMNPAHIAYECLTNPVWGMGYPAGVLDDASFRAAADVFHAEGLGLCFQWVRADSIEGFVQDVMNHAGAVLAQDPRTGLFRLLPIRGGYDVATLPEFRRGLNVLSVESFERAAITETVNEVVVNYTDVSTGKAGAVTVQQLANIQAQGGVVSQPVQYQGIPTVGLAERVGLRDLMARSQPLCKVRLLADRSAYGILPGQVVRWSDAKLGVADMPMRVLQVNYGTLTAGAITLDLAEDVYGLPATSYLGQQPSGWEEPPVEPQPAPAVAALELPYVAIHRAEGASVANALDPAAGFLAMAAARPQGVNYGFTLYTRTGSADYEQTGAGEWTPGGPLLTGIDSGDTLLTLDPPRGLHQVDVGGLGMLGAGPEAELVRVDAVNVPGGTVTVARGVGDTIARSWPLGTRFWALEEGIAASATEFADGEAVDAKAATQASAGELALDFAPTRTVAMDARAARPYVPGRFAVNGDAAPDGLFGELTVTWAHRDRLLQADQLVPQSAASIGPEPGTTYTLRTYLATVLVDEQTGLTGTSATVNPGGNGNLRIELEAVRDGLTSWHKHVCETDYTIGPVNKRVTVGSDPRVTVLGSGRISIG